MPNTELDPAPEALPGSGPVILAFSGGGDSVCLLHQFHRLTQTRGLLAVHVDHGLDHGSAKRAARAVALAASAGVDCQIERVKVRRSGSLEANARHARYAALAGYMHLDGVLLTAHHADDLAETMILRLLRGAGPGGLAGIPRQRRFGAGWLVRPLLGWSRPEILEYLETHALDWISDPANDLPAMDRNFIRHEILPLLKNRFPGAVTAINRSAALNRAALVSLNALAARDLDQARRSGARLHWPSLAQLDPFRRSEAVRRWCLERGYPPPPGPRLDEFLRQVDSSARDRLPQMRWGKACIRYWHDCLWLEAQGRQQPEPWRLSWDGRDALDLPDPSGRLELVGPGPHPVLDLDVRSGQPGEKIRLAERSGHRQVKDLMLQHGVPPWQRPLWPRLYSGDRLVAVGERWLDADFAGLLGQTGLRLEWQSDLFQAGQGPENIRPDLGAWVN